MLIPPTWSKVEHQRQLSSVWRRAAYELNQAERIVVCGYSLPGSDSFFRDLVAISGSDAHRLRNFYVFDPDANVRTRFERFLGPGALQRFRFEHWKFADSYDKFWREFF